MWGARTFALLEWDNSTENNKEIDYEKLAKSAAAGDLDDFYQVVRAIETKEFDPWGFNDSFICDLAQELIKSKNLINLARNTSVDNTPSIVLLVDIKNQWLLEWDDLDIDEGEWKKFDNVATIEELRYLVKRFKEERVWRTEQIMYLTSIYDIASNNPEIHLEYAWMTQEEFDEKVLEFWQGIFEKIKRRHYYPDYLDLDILVWIWFNLQSVNMTLEKFKEGKAVSRDLFFNIKSIKKERTDTDSTSYKITHAYSRHNKTEEE